MVKLCSRHKKNILFIKEHTHIPAKFAVKWFYDFREYFPMLKVCPVEVAILDF